MNFAEYLDVFSGYAVKGIEYVVNSEYGRQKMLTIKEYIKVLSLEQAYELNQKRTNRIISGMLWMKMGKERINTAVDLSELGLDTIKEAEDELYKD